MMALNPKEIAYSIGKQYELERMSLSKSNKSTKDIEEHIAKENNVTTRTVRTDRNFAQSVDIAENILPGMKEKILHNKGISISIDDFSSLHSLSETSQKKVVDAISKNERETVLLILKENKSKFSTPSGLEESESYNANDLLEDIRCANANLEAVLRQDMIALHNDILNNKEGREKALTGLNECQKTIKKYVYLIKAKERKNGT